MPVFMIQLPVPEELASYFLERDMIVTPMNEAEAEEFKDNLNNVGLTLQAAHAAFTALRKPMMDKGGMGRSIEELDGLIELLGSAIRRMELVGERLAHSARVGLIGPGEGETIQ